ncbi:biotin carboxylase [Sporosarcina ureilytica]|uniref:Biotin carboxylase n=2 Tax=Sporosarcina ureilytica TaxID=298596 RepID=A0A1D8JGY2_9BACL|nr:biotin carboxylase [Sporosarcina ureilytica]
MNAIVFIETTKSGSSREAIKAAESLGYLTVLMTGRTNFMKQRKEFSDVSQMIYLEEISEEVIRGEIEQLQRQGKIIKAILSFVDPFVSMAAKLMNETCNSAISVEALEKMEDKATTRRVLDKNTATPKYNVFKTTDNLNEYMKKSFNFPKIVKSAVSKASKNVYLVESKFEMEKAMKRVLKNYPLQKIILEEYLDGPQYLVEVLVCNGKINIVAIFKQEITKEITFIVTGYELQLNLTEERFKKLYQAVESILKDLKVMNAACHLEIRYVNENWKLIEINPRISGGAMNRMIKEAYGINLVEETIKLYLGYEPDLKRKYENHIYTHYITIGSYGYVLKITGRNKATHLPGVREVYIKPRKGAIVTPPRSMGHRYGYVIASGASRAEAKKNAVNAARNIKFYLDPI